MHLSGFALSFLNTEHLGRGPEGGILISPPGGDDGQQRWQETRLLRPPQPCHPTPHHPTSFSTRLPCSACHSLPLLPRVQNEVVAQVRVKRAFQVAQLVKNPPAEVRVRSLSLDDPPEEEISNPLLYFASQDKTEQLGAAFCASSLWLWALLGALGSDSRYNRKALKGILGFSRTYSMGDTSAERGCERKHLPDLPCPTLTCSSSGLKATVSGRHSFRRS